MNMYNLSIGSVSVLFTALVIVCLSSCQSNGTTIEQKKNVDGPIPKEWIDNRVSIADSTLNTTEAGKLVWQAMEAHGGLERWYANGPIDFKFDYRPRGEGARRYSSQIVDTWSNRSRHKDIEKPDAQYGWDGKQAWVTNEDTAYFKYDLRFWALTPIYFLAQPFNFDGQGVQLEKLADKTLEGKTYDAVKISFASGTGDAPDDYYINYYDKESHRLEALRYIVSYPQYFKDGGHSPEKIMTLHDFTTVGGITLPTRYETYMLGADEGKGEYVTDIEVAGISFAGDLVDSLFQVPKGAHLITEL